MLRILLCASSQTPITKIEQETLTGIFLFFPLIIDMRKTAKSFFAAASFLQVLAVFGELSLDVCLFALRLIDATGLKTQEKIKYAKWKATDIIKALNEGRKPVPGNPLEEEAPIQNEESHFSTLQTSVDQSKSTNFIQPPSTQIVDMPPNPPGYDPYSPSLPPPVENISRRFGNTSFGSPVLQEASQAPYTNSSQLETDAHQPHSAQCIQPQAAFQSPSVPSTSYPPTTYEQKGNAAFNPNLSGSTPGHHQQIAPVANPADPASQVPVIQSISSQPTSARDSDPFAYDYEGIANAQKACKHAMSCIQFDDIENAVANLQKAMNLLKPFLQKKS